MSSFIVHYNTTYMIYYCVYNEKTFKNWIELYVTYRTYYSLVVGTSPIEGKNIPVGGRCGMEVEFVGGDVGIVGVR